MFPSLTCPMKKWVYSCVPRYIPMPHPINWWSRMDTCVISYISLTCSIKQSGQMLTLLSGWIFHESFSNNSWNPCATSFFFTSSTATYTHTLRSKSAKLVYISLHEQRSITAIYIIVPSFSGPQTASKNTEKISCLIKCCAFNVCYQVSKHNVLSQHTWQQWLYIILLYQHLCWELQKQKYLTVKWRWRLVDEGCKIVGSQQHFGFGCLPQEYISSCYFATLNCMYWMYRFASQHKNLMTGQSPAGSH